MEAITSNVIRSHHYLVNTSVIYLSHTNTDMFPLSLSTSSPYSWLTTGFLTTVIWRMPLVGQEQLSCPEHMNSPVVFFIRFAQYLFSVYSFVDHCPFVLFFLPWPLHCLSCVDLCWHYSFGIVKLYLNLNIVMGTYLFILILLICNKYIDIFCKGNEYAIGIIGICNLFINIDWTSTKSVMNINIYFAQCIHLIANIHLH